MVEKTTEFGELVALGGDITRTHLTRFVKWMLNHPASEGRDPFPVYEHLSDGWYRREVHIPAGHLIVGAVHTQDSYAIMMQGKILVVDEDGSRYVEGASTFTQQANKQKVGYVMEDTIWLDIHKSDADTCEQAYSELFLDTYDDLDRLDYRNLLAEQGLQEEEVRAITEGNKDLVAFPEQILEVVEIRPSDIEGYGMFALRQFREGDVIAPSRIGMSRTPAGRYTNHSIAPNAVAIVTDDVIDFMAACNINIGDEITVDYRQTQLAAKQLDLRGQSCQQS